MKTPDITDPLAALNAAHRDLDIATLDHRTWSQATASCAGGMLMGLTPFLAGVDPTFAGVLFLAVLVFLVVNTRAFLRDMKELRRLRRVKAGGA